jgi:hypothetical protein
MSEWIEWQPGFEMPRGQVSVRVRNGVESRGDYAASWWESEQWDWTGYDRGYNIVAYREACPSCAQPADEPCPSSCWVDVPRIMGFDPADAVDAFSYALLASPMSHPKAQERQHISDAAWERTEGNMHGLEHRDVWEKLYAERGIILVTIEEWDEREDAAVNFNLAQANAGLREENTRLHAELERLRKEVKNDLSTGQDAVTRAAHAKNAGLLLTTNTDHRLGSGNVLEGKPEYQEPKPVIRTRPML